MKITYALMTVEVITKVEAKDPVLKLFFQYVKQLTEPTMKKGFGYSFYPKEGSQWSDIEIANAYLFPIILEVSIADPGMNNHDLFQLTNRKAEELGFAMLGWDLEQ